MDITDKILQDVAQEIEKNKGDFEKMKDTAIKANLNTQVVKAISRDELEYSRRERAVYFFLMTVFLASTVALASALILTR
jgi:hypothetical protein